MKDIKDMVKDNKIVTFNFYRKGKLFYKTECGFDFPVPIEDTGDASFLYVEKAIHLMRYIRMHLEVIEKEETKLKGGEQDDIQVPEDPR